MSGLARPVAEVVLGLARVVAEFERVRRAVVELEGRRRSGELSAAEAQLLVELKVRREGLRRIALCLYRPLPEEVRRVVGRDWEEHGRVVFRVKAGLCGRCGQWLEAKQVLAVGRGWMVRCGACGAFLTREG